MQKTQIPPIEVDFDVHKKLYSLTNYPNEPFNNVLRRLLNLDLASAENYPLAQAVNRLGTLEIKNERRGILVKGIEINGGKGIKVLKGGRFSKTVAPKFKGSYAELRQRMIREGILNPNLELTQDYAFNSKSAAASVILGTQANGNPWE